MLIEATAALNWGDPSNPETDIGPMVSVKHRDRVAALVERALKHCAPPVLPLGEAPSRTARHAAPFYPPTILACEDPDSEIVQEESFGPVLVVQTARDFPHAIALMNGVRRDLPPLCSPRLPTSCGRFSTRPRPAFSSQPVHLGRRCRRAVRRLEEFGPRAARARPVRPGIFHTPADDLWRASVKAPRELGHRPAERQGPKREPPPLSYLSLLHAGVRKAP